MTLVICMGIQVIIITQKLFAKFGLVFGFSGFASNCPDLGISLLLYEQWSPGVYSTPPAENSYNAHYAVHGVLLRARESSTTLIIPKQSTRSPGTKYTFFHSFCYLLPMINQVKLSVLLLSTSLCLYHNFLV
jgi:hypothetical protein